ncbi:KinB-signaling pathway activation protein [Bacillus atrophaeus]|uniref:KinB-signaling pathway activation protein n=1 Tax=Bacillus atrophaeus (strain 1942) TaxID=720555 RepID=A0ABM5M458_BACA1|nr:KinB-signaling pathway activation protein [Bacillus atrophaeus]AMR64336.1 KinB-signaling pathway activation protein [Bacillus subtilis subsp. globigii]ADP34796.1 KinB signaling pathway activation protein [Bacillus atrophaeus 1942]AIK46644.1 kinB-signaling pathway activation in sporulation family protein [Bacillus atrophaeus subsp. globigii]EIM09425.1 KinB signaling pathway activation protein [Bacillus atrophaeus C89]KFK81117.1 kinB-signaling pathway activation in sporulation family protein 
MKSRGLVRFFFSILAVGALITSIVGFALKWGEYKELFINLEIGEIFSVLLWFVGVGMIFSVISQMGFFVFLTVHRFALEILRSSSLWNWLQLFLILFVAFDLMYVRFLFFGGSGESIIGYAWLPLFLLVFGLLVAYMKQKQSSKKTFISSLFLMVVITALEWFPALRVNEEDWLYLMLFPLMGCNAFQLLMLPKFAEK